MTDTLMTLEIASKSSLMNKTKPQIIMKLSNEVLEKTNEIQHLKKVIELQQKELRDINKKYNINTSLETNLMTIDKDLNEPQPQIQPPDPVVMYNHTLAVKVEEQNTELRNKCNQLSNQNEDLKKLVKLHEDAVCNNCGNMEKLEKEIEVMTNQETEISKKYYAMEKELEDSKHAYLLMKKEKDSIAHNYEVLDNQVKTGTAKRYYAMEERCKNEEAQKQHYERLMTDYKGQVIEADMFRNSLKKFINGGKRLEF